LKDPRRVKKPCFCEGLCGKAACCTASLGGFCDGFFSWWLPSKFVWGTWGWSLFSSPLTHGLDFSDLLFFPPLVFFAFWIDSRDLLLLIDADCSPGRRFFRRRGLFNSLPGGMSPSVHPFFPSLFTFFFLSDIDLQDL